MYRRQILASLLLLLLYMYGLMPAAQAYRGDYYNYPGGYFAYHPYVQKALLGGGLGALVGGAVSSRGDTVGGAMKGALIGGGAGLGYQFLTQNGMFSNGYGRPPYYFHGHGHHYGWYHY